MQIKIIMWYNYTLIKPYHMLAWCGGNELSFTPDGNSKCSKHIGKQFGSNCILIMCSNHSIPSTHPREKKAYSHTKTCAQMFTAASFVIAPNWKQHKCICRVGSKVTSSNFSGLGMSTYFLSVKSRHFGHTCAGHSLRILHYTF